MLIYNFIPRIAGSDTTSNSLTGIIHLIMTHPTVYSKLLAALEDRVDDDVPEHSQVKDIPYLDATIDEGSVDFSLAIFAHTQLHK